LPSAIGVEDVADAVEVVRERIVLAHTIISNLLTL
jgi:hypothetical protein